jgi:gluconate 2-dehydrogenase gamma chain
MRKSHGLRRSLGFVSLLPGFYAHLIVNSIAGTLRCLREILATSRPMERAAPVMSWYRNLSRRDFLKTAATAAVATEAISCGGSRTPWRFLTVNQARSLAAVCDQLIPPDDDPGADWARVVNYIDIQLCGPYRHLREDYRNGIASLEQTSQQKFGKIFAQLANQQQLALLTQLEKGEAPRDLWHHPQPQAFFEMVLAHTMEGFYGDPRHGGNRDHASWKMVGLSYPQIRGRQHFDGKDCTLIFPSPCGTPKVQP